VTARVTAVAGAASAAFRASVKITFVGGAITVGGMFDQYSVVDTALAGSSIAFVGGAAGFTLACTSVGAAATWTGVVELVT
jgi:hypothetical protein